MGVLANLGRLGFWFTLWLWAFGSGMLQKMLDLLMIQVPFVDRNQLVLAGYDP